MASLIETYNDGEGVTTVVWMDENFAPVEPGSDNAKYVKMIASTGELSFYYVNQERAAEWNEEDHPRDEDGKFTSSGGSRSESHTKLSTGKPTSEETITGSANSVKKITLRDVDGNEVEAIFKPTSGESWTYNDMARKEALNNKSANKEEFGVDTAGLQKLVDEGAFDTEDEPVRETITNRDFSYAAREVAAYEIDEALGLGVVPPTVQRQVDGQEGMVQEFVETNRYNPPRNEVDPDSIYGLAILDIATGNTDRHAGNVLVDTNKRVVAIDQGLTFPDDSEYGANYQFRPDATLDFLEGNHKPMSKEMSDRVASKISNTDWTEAAKQWRMSGGERESFYARMIDLRRAIESQDTPEGRSRAIRTLISSMALESKIAGGHDPKEVKQVEGE